MIGISDILNHGDDDTEGSIVGWCARVSKASTRTIPHIQTKSSFLTKGSHKGSLTLLQRGPPNSSSLCNSKCLGSSHGPSNPSKMSLNSIESRETEPATQPETEPETEASIPSSSSGSSFSTGSSLTDVSSESPSNLSTIPNRKASEPPKKPILVHRLSARSRLPKSRIHKHILSNKSFVKLAIRGKTAKKELSDSRSGSRSGSKSSSTSGPSFKTRTTDGPTSSTLSAMSSTSSNNLNPHILNDSSKGKLHVRSLESGLRVKLSLIPSLVSLYHHLVPFTHKQKQAIPVIPSTDLSIVEGNKPTVAQKYGSNPKQTLASQSVKLIDNNLVDLSGLSKKVLKSFSLTNDTDTLDSLTTYNSLNTAIHSAFRIKEYSLVRVTRSTTDEDSGSIVLKLETAHPGDCKLVDDPNFVEEMLYSLGNHLDDPSNLFIKKVVARPRYKSDMKIYLIPQRISCSLYINERMFERDLFNGVIEFNYENNTITNGDKDVFVTFPHQHIIDEFQRMMEMSEEFEAGLKSYSNETSSQSITCSP